MGSSLTELPGVARLSPILNFMHLRIAFNGAEGLGARLHPNAWIPIGAEHYSLVKEAEGAYVSQNNY